MANGTTRLSLSRMQLNKQKGQHEYMQEIEEESKGKKSKIPLKNPTKNNHSK